MPTFPAASPTVPHSFAPEDIIIHHFTQYNVQHFSSRPKKKIDKMYEMLLRSLITSHSFGVSP